MGAKLVFSKCLFRCGIDFQYLMIRADHLFAPGEVIYDN